ncbi:hypothetical protein K458DRAFT_400550 [Lentithecium fluviatile CBS 122367]|uniref:Uncharacterized protein n=1 Tax=Lentithecium fluviatile CBS 122367 TaxID=1168545 RepID=A0A6G1JCT1_9PLEO|nr:hypothetical protein K458DRAFT_400550 [Lentithecium fluviatile CBS 122367]
MASTHTGIRPQSPMKADVGEENPERPIQDDEPSSMKEKMTTSMDEDKSQDNIVHPTHATDAFAYNVDKTMEAIDGIMLAGLHESQPCPWHTRQVSHENKHIRDLDPMGRYMAEAEAEQSTVYHGVQKGTLSITKPCTCAEVLSAAMNLASRISSVEQYQLRLQANSRSH